MGIHRPKSPIPKIKAFIRSTVPQKSISPATTARKRPAHQQGGKLPKLPKHVVLNIADHLSTWDLLHLSLSCKHLRQTLLSSLYHTLDLKTNRSIIRLLPALPHRPEIHPHVKHLIIRPNNVLYTAPGEEMDEKRVADWVTDLLGGGTMDGLEGFVWDGREMASEDVWLVLRTECPLITRLGTSIGGNPLNSRSHFYEFSNLTSLSLTVKCPEYGWTTGPPPAPEKLPRRFWAMLIERCPGLVSLSFTGHAPCPRIFDARHIMHGRWDNLRHLDVGEMVCFLEGSSSNPASEIGHGQRRSPSRGSSTSIVQRDAFASFLALHPSITNLTLSHPTLPTALPHLPILSSLTAPPNILRVLPTSTKRTLQTLRVSILHHTPAALSSSCGILSEYTGLQSLSLWVDFSFSGGYGIGGVRGVVESILRSITPHLESIELWLLTRSGCSLDDVLLAFRSAASSALGAVKLMVLFDGKEVDAQRVWSVLPGMREVEIWKSAEPWLSACGGWVRSRGQWEVVGEREVDGQEGKAALTVAAYEWKDCSKSRTRMFTRDITVDIEERRMACEVQDGTGRAGLRRTPGSTSTTSSSGSSGSGSSKSTAQSLSSFDGKSVSTTYSVSGSQYQKPLPHVPVHSPTTSVFSTAPSTISFSSLPPQDRMHRGSVSIPSSPSMAPFSIPHPAPPPAPPLIFLSDSGKIPDSPSDRKAARRASLSTISQPPSAFASSGNISRRPSSSFMGMQPPSSWRSASPSKPTTNSTPYTPPKRSTAGMSAENLNTPPSSWLSRRLSFTSLGGSGGKESKTPVGRPRSMTVHFDDPPVSRGGSVDGHGSRPASIHGGSGSSHPSSVDGHGYIGSRPSSISGESRRSRKSLKSWVGSVVGR